MRAEVEGNTDLVDVDDLHLSHSFHRSDNIRNIVTIIEITRGDLDGMIHIWIA